MEKRRKPSKKTTNECGLSDWRGKQRSPKRNSTVSSDCCARNDWPRRRWAASMGDKSAALHVHPQSEKLIRPRARRVQIISGPEHRDHIQRAGAIEIVRLRNRPADARGPAIGIVEYKE